ncbi:hypothetical protein AB837_00206 [bacterium AB1]|nr:hypothetical protein AB837_00206 [bacterium AB1]
MFFQCFNSSSLLNSPIFKKSPFKTISIDMLQKTRHQSNDEFISVQKNSLDNQENTTNTSLLKDTNEPYQELSRSSKLQEIKKQTLNISENLLKENFISKMSVLYNHNYQHYSKIANINTMTERLKNFNYFVIQLSDEEFEKQFSIKDISQFNNQNQINQKHRKSLIKNIMYILAFLFSSIILLNKSTKYIAFFVLPCISFIDIIW